MLFKMRVLISCVCAKFLLCNVVSPVSESGFAGFVYGGLAKKRKSGKQKNSRGAGKGKSGKKGHPETPSGVVVPEAEVPREGPGIISHTD